MAYMFNKVSHLTYEVFDLLVIRRRQFLSNKCSNKINYVYFERLNVKKKEKRCMSLK